MRNSYEGGVWKKTIEGLLTMNNRRGSRNFSKGGGVRRKILKEKCLLIHVSSRVHIKTTQTCNSFSLLHFQENCLLFFCIVLLHSFIYDIWKEEGGGVATPIPRPLLDPPMYYTDDLYQYTDHWLHYNSAFLCHSWFLIILWWTSWYAIMSPSDKKSV